MALVLIPVLHGMCAPYGACFCFAPHLPNPITGRCSGLCELGYFPHGDECLPVGPAGDAALSATHAELRCQQGFIAANGACVARAPCCPSPPLHNANVCACGPNATQRGDCCVSVASLCGAGAVEGPVCTCGPGYAFGAAGLCDVWAPGCPPGSCGVNGACTPDGACVCAPGWSNATGTGCVTCAVGYGGFACARCPAGASYCEEEAGPPWALLPSPRPPPPPLGACPANRTGPECRECLPGFVATPRECVQCPPGTTFSSALDGCGGGVGPGTPPLEAAPPDDDAAPPVLFAPPVPAGVIERAVAAASETGPAWGDWLALAVLLLSAVRYAVQPLAPAARGYEGVSRRVR